MVLYTPCIHVIECTVNDPYLHACDCRYGRIAASTMQMAVTSGKSVKTLKVPLMLTGLQPGCPCRPHPPCPPPCYPRSRPGLAPSASVTLQVRFSLAGGNFGSHMHVYLPLLSLACSASFSLALLTLTVWSADFYLVVPSLVWFYHPLWSDVVFGHGWAGFAMLAHVACRELCLRSPCDCTTPQLPAL